MFIGIDIFSAGVVVGVFIGYSLAKRRGGLSVAREAVARRARKRRKGGLWSFLWGKRRFLMKM
jgi:hypothetical protein